jgi:hypothetical protein
MKKIALALVLLFVPSISRADQLYAVNGSLTIVGNNVCSGPCVETINFSFDFREQPVREGGDYFLSIVPDTSSVVSFGPLGTFGAPDGGLAGLFSPAPGPGSPDSNFIEFRTGPIGSPFTEIDIWVSQNLLPEPFVPQIAGADLWRCDTQACITDFCPSSFCTQAASTVVGIRLPGTVESEVRPVSAPEPGTLPLLGIAFLALFLLRIRSVCSRASSLKFFQ